jgi:Rho-type GTPase-activating protein 1/2
MARRRKKSRAAAQSKLKEKDLLVDKSLPALPPNAIPQGAFSPNPDTPGSVNTDTPTELSPRPRTGYPQNGSSSRSSSRRERSLDRSAPEATNKDGLTLPSSTYRNNRHSAISQASDITGADGESFFIPLALDSNPAPTITPRSVTDSRVDPTKSLKDKRPSENDYFAMPKPTGRVQTGDKQGISALTEQEVNSQGSSPHIAFQEKGRQLSSEQVEKSKESSRKPLPPSSRTGSAKGSPSIGNDDTRMQHTNSNNANSGGKTQSSTEKFRLQEVPKSKRGTSRSTSQSDIASSGGETDGMRSLSEDTSTSQRKEPSSNLSRSGSTKGLLSAERTETPRLSQESRLSDDTDSRPSTDSTTSSLPPAKLDSQGLRSIARKDIASGPVKGSLASSPDQDTPSSSTSSSETPGATPTINGKTISGPLLHLPKEDELGPPAQAPTRPAPPQQKISDSYMVPRAPPAPPTASHKAGKSSVSSMTTEPVSPKLPRWSAGGDFTMDEDMARILGTDESAQSILRRVSNAVRHGRNASEASNTPRHGRSISETTRTTASPRWPKTPITEDTNDMVARDISSPISIASPSADDAALLRRQLRNSEQRVAELERQFTSAGELQTLNKKLIEKRKTASVLDSQAELMIRQIEVLAGFVEKAKDSKQPLDLAELEESAIKEFVQKIEKLKQSMSAQVEQLLDERNDLIEEKNQAMKDRDRALVEFEQLSSKNAQLADLNNDLTHQIQERFKAQTGNGLDSPRPLMNGLGIYSNHHKDKSSASVLVDDISLRSNNTTLYGPGNNYPQAMEQDPSMDPATVLSAPHVVNIRKGQAKKFNWKKGGVTVAKGVSKGFKGAFSSDRQERNQWQGQTGDNIGVPYNMTMAPMESPLPIGTNNGPRSVSNDPARQGGFGLFKKSGTMPKAQSNGSLSAIAAEHPTNLFGSELVDRAEYERRQIPSVVTRCIEEVELRGMDIEGIYRKTGGSGQVKVIQEGFEKTEDYDISDPGLDITAVTSVLKQYFRKLPTPLLTFDIYDRVLDSICK